MLRISRLTDYATVILASLAERPERVQTATALAEQTRIAAPTVSKQGVDIQFTTFGDHKQVRNLA